MISAFRYWSIHVAPGGQALIQRWARWPQRHSRGSRYAVKAGIRLPPPGSPATTTPDFHHGNPQFPQRIQVGQISFDVQTYRPPQKRRCQESFAYILAAATRFPSLPVPARFTRIGGVHFFCGRAVMGWVQRVWQSTGGLCSMRCGVLHLGGPATGTRAGVRPGSASHRRIDHVTCRTSF
jgi:hypothetical protein